VDPVPGGTAAGTLHAAAGAAVPERIGDCAEDVAIAGEIDACRVVPVLTDGAFTPAS